MVSASRDSYNETINQCLNRLYDIWHAIDLNQQRYRELNAAREYGHQERHDDYYDCDRGVALRIANTRFVCPGTTAHIDAAKNSESTDCRSRFCKSAPPHFSTTAASKVGAKNIAALAGNEINR